MTSNDDAPTIDERQAIRHAYEHFENNLRPEAAAGSGDLAALDAECHRIIHTLLDGGAPDPARLRQAHQRADAVRQLLEDLAALHGYESLDESEHTMIPAGTIGDTAGGEGTDGDE